ncbi:hypothetical protein BGZ76_002752 [Entomortierella beljakovae]|nr:hypothetical protein BGZ76_002752 [Entomortierella beljakovae]
MNSKDIVSLPIPEYALYLEKYYNITIIPSDLDTTERDNMVSGRMYDCTDKRLDLGRQRGNEIVAILNRYTKEKMDDGRKETDNEEERRREALLFLLTDGNMGQGCKADSLKVDYGSNMVLGEGVVLKSNIVVLDCARVFIGDGTTVESGAQIYSATHPVNPLLRTKFDYAMQVSIGKDCWIGPKAIICPGVVIGDGVVVEAGSVVAKSVPSFVVVSGAPAKIIGLLNKEENERQTLSQDFQYSHVETTAQ